jgi:aerobic-type carbon monoxide dehydrogenase small subunit (CoxS/CutS family)
VRINGKPARSCLLPIGSTDDRKIITIDKMAQRRSRMRG